MNTRTLSGFGLHGGAPAQVTLRARPGPVTLRVGEHEAPLHRMRVVGTVRAVTLEAPGGAFRVRTVDHLFAALGALALHEGVAIDVEGGELPLLGGGAKEYCAALRALDVPASAPRLRVVRAARVEARASAFEVAPSPSVRVVAEVDFDDPRLAPGAAWEGDGVDFERRIAPARTFAFAHEVESFLARGLARHVTPESVVVIGEDAVFASGGPFAPDEPARHKVLDLVGDLYVHGGPPVGLVRAHRPGHGATHEAVRALLESGALALS